MASIGIDIGFDDTSFVFTWYQISTKISIAYP